MSSPPLISHSWICGWRGHREPRSRSVCLALYVAFWLELDNAYWAGTSAAIVCQPQVGASLRKGWFRMIGTLVGAVAIVVLTACFPQDRALFLVGLAVWGGLCAFAATVLRNFASYSAALAGYTAAIIAADTLGATGGASTEVFMLAVWRASEICLGIVCAGVVLAGTDLGGAPRRLAALFASLGAEIMSRFAGSLANAAPELLDTQPVRWEFVRRIIALDPIIDQALGESSRLRYHSPILQSAVDGLFGAMAGWRGVATHLLRLPRDEARQEAGAILQTLQEELRSPPELRDPGSGSGAAPARWMADPTGQQRIYEAAARRLIALPASTPSLRLLADQTEKLLAGMAQALNGLALLVADQARTLPERGDVRLRVADWLPAFVNAGRAFVTIGVVALFWIVTAWPGGAGAITFAAVTVLLFAPRADQAYAFAMLLTVGTLFAAMFAAVIAFAVLPGLPNQTFGAFAAVVGLYLVPSGALMAQPWLTPMFIGMTANFVPLLAPANPESYDPAQFYNQASAILAGAGAGALSFRLLPPLSPAFRTRRLLALTLRDLRRLARGRTREDWEGHVLGRLVAMPDAATPLQRAQLMAALSIGSEILQLRQIARRLGLDLEPALAAVAQGDSATATAHLAQVDATLVAQAAIGPETQTVLRARAGVLAFSEALTQHAAYFDSGPPR
jgi:uncharacterized membrane protein YccC